MLQEPELLNAAQAIHYIATRYEPMYYMKLWAYCRDGWFETVEFPGNKIRIRKSSIIDAYEKCRPSDRYQYNRPVGLNLDEVAVRATEPEATESATAE